MPKTIKYIGTRERWPEIAVTGKQSVWIPGQQEERSDLEAMQLLSAGQFVEVLSVEDLSIPSLVSGAASIPSPNVTIEAPVVRAYMKDNVSTGVSVNNMTRVVDQNVTWGGIPALRCTPGSGNEYFVYNYSAGAQSFRGFDSIWLRFYIEDLTGNPYVSITVANNPDWVTDSRSVGIPLGGVRKGWNYVRLRWDDTTSGANIGPINATAWTTSGSPSIQKDIRAVKFDLVNANGKPIWLHSWGVGGFQRAMVLLTFDNWGVDHDQYIRRVLNKYGFKAGICAITSTIDNPVPNRHNVYTTFINAAYTDGHDICTDDTVDRPLGNESAATVRAAVAACRSYFTERGWIRGRDYWILNNNSYSDAVVSEFRAGGIRAARAGISERRFGCHEAGVDDPYRLGAQSCDGYTVTTLKQLFDRTATYGATFCAYWHKFFPKAEALEKVGVAVNTDETPQAYLTRMAGLGGATATAAASWASTQGVDALASWTDDFEEAMAYLATLQQQGKVVQVGPERWMGLMGL